jgi:hypothetical protein
VAPSSPGNGNNDKPRPSADDSSSNTTYDIDIKEGWFIFGGPPQRSSNFKSSTIGSSFRLDDLCGVIYYNGRYYIPAISQLLQDLLKSIDITALHLLAIGLHTITVSPTTPTSSSSILLMEEWPHLRLPSAIVVFFDDNGQQLLSISDVYINMQLAHGRPMISPADYNIGDLLFGQLQDFATSPPSIMPTTLRRHIHG